MNKRIFGMDPGGRFALDRAANRRRNIRFSAKVRAQQVGERTGRAREKKGGQADG